MQEKIKKIIVIVFLILFAASEGFAELKLESVSPNLGEMGKDLQVTLTGTGFDENTRVSMYPDTGNRRQIIGSVDTPGGAYGVAVNGDTAFVADGDDGLQVIDVSTPSHPKIIGSADTPGSAEKVTVIGNTAFVLDSSVGLKVIDVSTLSQPKIIGPVDPLDACGMTVIGNTAFVVDGKSLQVIDVSTPSQPKIIGSVDTPGVACEVAVNGNTAFVGDWSGGLQVIDVSMLSQPRIIGSADTPGYTSGVAVNGDTVFVANGDGGLQVIDVSTPSQPVIIGFTGTPSYHALGVTVIDDTAFVAEIPAGFGDSRLRVIDVSTPSQPEIIGSVYTPGPAWGVTVSGDTAFMADGDGGLQVIDVSNPQLSVIGSVETPGNANGVAVIGDTAFVADGDGGLQMIDVSTLSQPSHIEIIGSVETPGGWANGVTVISDTAFVTDGLSGLHVIDVNTPSQPEIIGGVHFPHGETRGVTVIGDTAFVGNVGLHVIDVSTPSQPEIIGYVSMRYSRGVAAIGDAAFMADERDGLQVIDVSTPSQPVIIGSVDTPYSAEGVAVKDDTAFVADGSAGLQVIDVSTLSQSVIIGSVDTPGYARGVAVSGDTVFVADGSAGLQVIDVSTPSRPLIISTVDTLGSAEGVTLNSDTVFVADGLSGLTIIPLNLITEISPVTVNSKTGISLTLPSPPAPGHYILRVFNGTEYDELPGAVTFVDSETYQKLKRQKAVIIAGSRSYPRDGLWQFTEKATNGAYLTLLSQGYTRESIMYLSPNSETDVDSDGFFNDVDGDATKANLKEAITVWAADATEVLIYMTDHGGRGTFQVNENEILLAEKELKPWLDDLQAVMPGRVILIYDACYSGSFIPLLTPPPGKERIIITSSGPEEPAWFHNNGLLSFSWQFWAAVFFDASLYRSLDDARGMMTGQQTVHLDANADGIGFIWEEMDIDRPDKLVIKDIIIGRGRVAASAPPVIGSVSGEQTLNGETSATVTAQEISALNPVVRVWAVILPPDYPLSPEQPVTDLPETSLSDSDGDGVYEGTYDGFTVSGTYKIAVYAEDSEKLYSPPAQTTVVQTAGSKLSKGDITGDGQITLRDAVTALRTLAGTGGLIGHDHPGSGADVNEDDRIGLAEAVYILKEIAQ